MALTLYKILLTIKSSKHQESAMNTQRYPAFLFSPFIFCLSLALLILSTSCSNQETGSDKNGLLGLLAASGGNVSGHVVLDGTGVSDVTISLSAWNGTTALATTTTDAQGNYILENIKPGYYQVTADLSADYGKNISRTITQVRGEDLTGINFVIDIDTTRTITGKGDVVGFVEDNGTHAWMGIPYAKPPTGTLRWRAPQSPDAWAKPYPAIAKCQVCSQYAELLSDAPRSLFGQPIGSEDCLYLNVWAPAYTPATVPTGDERVPVMVWIHGGGNSTGEGGKYNGKYLADAYGVIFVSINYRLGPLGWLSHPALQNEAGNTDYDKSGNFGTLDIIQALNWVKDNISNFGGQPGNVTVFGESAGGADTLTMLASARATGLFHRAVVESGGLGWTTRATAESYKESGGHDYSSREVINTLLVLDGTAADRAAAKIVQDGMSDAQISAYLRSKTAYELLAVYSGAFGGMISMPDLFRDGYVLPDADPLSLFQAGTYNKVPTILGTNRDEFKLFMAMNPEYTHLVMGLLPVVKDEAYYALTARYASDFWKVGAVDEIAAAMHANQGDTVYAYRFDWDEEPVIAGIDLGFVLGAAHGLEIPFVMNDSNGFLVPSMKDRVYDAGNLPGREFLAGCMSSYWTQFAISGIPGNGYGGSQAETWDPWDSTAGGDKMMIFDTLEDGDVRMSTTTITRDALKADLQAETGFTTIAQKCKVYVATFGVDPYYTANCSD
jgi:para-nitrobenzyl esterase